MKAQSGKAAVSKDAIPESEEQKFKQKCKELKKRIIEVEESNEIATLALYRTKMSIRRMRLEYAILLERLEEKAISVPDGNNDLEEMSPPPSPTILGESLKVTDSSIARNGVSKKGVKRVKGSAASNSGGSTRSQRIRDPDLPKRPTNAYLIFCEMERERIKQEMDEDVSGSLTDLSKTLTEAWKNLDDEKRKPYYKLYEDDRDRYQREMSIYNQRKQIEEDPKEVRKSKKQKTEMDEAEEPKDTKNETDDENAIAIPTSEGIEEAEREEAESGLQMDSAGLNTEQVEQLESELELKLED